MHGSDYLPQPAPGIASVMQECRRSLTCPECGRAVPLMGMRKVIRHPIAERLRANSFRITGWWLCFLGFAFISLMLADGPLFGRGSGWMFMGLPAVPGLLIYFISGSFPRYRVWSCPYCKFYHLERLRSRPLRIEKPKG